MCCWSQSLLDTEERPLLFSFHPTYCISSSPANRQTDARCCLYEQVLSVVLMREPWWCSFRFSLWRTKEMNLWWNLNTLHWMVELIPNCKRTSDSTPNPFTSIGRAEPQSLAVPHFANSCKCPWFAKSWNISYIQTLSMWSNIVSHISLTVMHKIYFTKSVICNLVEMGR